jgi:hypothetical protein
MLRGTGSARPAVAVVLMTCRSAFIEIVRLLPALKIRPFVRLNYLRPLLTSPLLSRCIAAAGSPV